VGDAHDGSLAPGRARRAPIPLVGPLLEPIYRSAITRINRRFDKGIGVERLPVPVVSVGNLSVGGTGKTPMVMFLASLLLEHGERPCIALRGYRSRRDAGSDEADSYTRALPEVCVVARPDRAVGIRELLQTSSPEQTPTCVLLDDGFQHRQIARHLDIVLIDAARSVFDDRLLPAGWLREAPASLARAHVVVVSHAELVTAREIDVITERVRAINPSAVIAVARHTWTHLMVHESGVDAPEGLELLLNVPIVGCCAIGHPEAFARSLTAVNRGLVINAGDRLASLSPPPILALPDHDPFNAATVRRLVDLAKSTNARAIVVTDKDWSKLRHEDPAIWPCPVARPQLALSFDSGRAELERAVLETVKSGRARSGQPLAPSPARRP
jgi:tetraacyldisaccharide 4'-kinase